MFLNNLFITLTENKYIFVWFTENLTTAVYDK